MLSDREKQEMLADGLNAQRHAQFAEARRQQMARQSRLLDDYIEFLMSIQKIFPFTHEKQKTDTTFNKL